MGETNFRALYIFITLKKIVLKNIFLKLLLRKFGFYFFHVRLLELLKMLFESINIKILYYKTLFLEFFKSRFHK